MNKKVVIGIVCILLALAAIVTVWLKNSPVDSQDLTDTYASSTKIEQENLFLLGFTKLGNSWYVADFQVANMPPNTHYDISLLTRVLFRVDGDGVSVYETLPDRNLALIDYSKKEIPPNIKERIRTWPMQPLIHEDKRSSLQFYSGDIQKKARGKIMGLFREVGFDTRPENISVRASTYSKATRYPSAKRFIIDVKHPSSSYEVIVQSYTRLKPQKDVIYITCVADGATADELPHCIQDTVL